MAGRPPQVGHIREAFLRHTLSAKELVETVQGISSVRATPGQARLHPEQARRIVELAFLGLISAWEEFLEQAFVRYLAGASSDNQVSAPLRMGPASSIAHAYHLISGDPDFDPARNYSKFSDPKWVIDIARNYFELGSPFAPVLSQNIDLLQHAAKLRNRVAHNSTKCREDFKKSARIHLGLAQGAALTQGYSVGDLLLEPAQRLFGQQIANKPDVNYFLAYGGRLRAIAKLICPRS